MTRKWTMLIGTGMGAGLMYLFDPDRGPARRARLRDRYTSAVRAAQQATDTANTDLLHRAQGWTQFARSFLASDVPVNDKTLVARVRSALGRASTHPSSIDVNVHDGRVILRGPVLAEEVPLVMDCVYGVRGVIDVENQLEVHAAPGDVSGLQGTDPRASTKSGDWTPAARLGIGAGGGLLALNGLVRGGFVSRALGVGGFALLARAATNMDMRRLTGIGARHRGVDIQKTVRIQAPIERVFEIWEHCENFPNFLSHVRHVQQLQDGQSKRWRWTVTGPAGTEFDFDTALTAYEKNRVLGWRTDPGSLIQHAGHIRFSEEPGGATRADIRMTYNPVAGAVGHAVARLFGADAKRQMDDDIVRMKQYIETGLPPHDAAAASRPSL